jgi:hypothetical protein
MRRGWPDLVDAVPAAAGGHPIGAYSEFMPAPLLGRKPCGGLDPLLFRAGDPRGWYVTEYEETLELRPGLEHIAGELMDVFLRLGRGDPAHGLGVRNLDANPCWPETLHHRGAPPHERYVLLLPLALSRTQDDKGRIRWTLFGASEQGAARPFWHGFSADARRGRPAEQCRDFFERLLLAVFGERSLQRFRIHADTALPRFTSEYIWREGQPLTGVRYLLTFTPFCELPGNVQTAYLRGDLHLLPFPGSLLYFHAAPYRRLQAELRWATQIPLLHSIERRESPRGIRVPQSGWLHEPREDDYLHPPAHHHGPIRNTMRRTHRWARVHRDEDELAVSGREDKVAHVLFSTNPSDLGLYDKPMARNAQLWTRDYRRLLNGPNADRKELIAAAKALEGGGLFGYRFLYPPMRVGRHEVFWHRPLVAWRSMEGDRTELLDDAPLGYLTAFDVNAPGLKPIELWPRLLQRQEHLLALEAFGEDHRGLENVRKILEADDLAGEGKLDPGFARALIVTRKNESLDDWLESLPEELGRDLRRRIVPKDDACRTESQTFRWTASRSFEERYWSTIARLAEGRFVNKDNADCVLDRATQSQLVHRQRDLEALGDHLLAGYERLLQRQPVRGAVAGWLPFRWQTDFDFGWSGGWLQDQRGEIEQRNMVFVIPGRDRSEAVMMADHYDTAYMEDRFGKGRQGPRLAAAGADDNHSATAALMLAAPMFLAMSKAGKLERDIWLVHLTGEEFPADCLGARHLCRCLSERSLFLHRHGEKPLDLSKTNVKGAFVLDMVAHNNDRARDVFQICPGSGPESMALAHSAHSANASWNASVDGWNGRPRRSSAGRGQRSTDSRSLPPLARHLKLHGQVRPPSDPHSTLYNTDGQIFSDVGVPVVLFMENYDINRHGYHDSLDTMQNIDLDYGAALVAIAIETVARVAGPTLS